MPPDHEIVLRLLAETSSNGLEKFGCDYCLVEFSEPQLVELLDTSLRVTAWKELVPGLAEVALFPPHCVTFLSSSPALNELEHWDDNLAETVLDRVLDAIDGNPVQDALSESEWVALPLSLEIPPSYEQRSEYERVELDACGGIRWQGYPKHSATLVDTPELHRDVLRDFLQNLTCLSKPVPTSS